MLGYGLYIGWFSPFTMILKKVDQTPFPEPLSVVDESWIGSIICLGTAFGTLTFGYLGEHIGARSSLISSSILFVVNDIESTRTRTN